MKINISLLLILALFFCHTSVFAQTSEDATSGNVLNPLACTTFGECFDIITTRLFYAGTAVVILSILIAGAIFITGGTPARIALAKKIVLLGIGIFVIILLVKFVAIISRDYLNLKNT
ncbi:MAG: hypothetical protein WC309_03620 [Candidatus Paceibacterota bacterium]|jgi:predicted signal transduction protein with EAL and GGDEF domain